ncbi:ROK family protein [Streptomyces sp. NPDC057651]|uniref:ROK family protein n=1 Tax=Streptomyces sp. NPDC057651 TaxID=3346194 RepID=UPI0036B38759
MNAARGAGARVMVALDIGGTTLSGGLVAEDGAVLCTAQRPAVRDGGRDPGLRGTVALARELTFRARDMGAQPVGIGAGFPEYVTGAGALTSRDVIGWDEQPAGLLAPLVPGRPVVIESDVRCGALAEARTGRGRGLGSFLYVSVGTGLSAAFVQDERVWAGQRGEALGLGTWPVHGRPTPDLEGYASGSGIAARYSAVTGSAVTGARAVVTRAEAGDAAAFDVLSTAGDALGTALAWAVALLDPAAIVVGGGLGTAGGLLDESMRTAYATHARRRGRPPVRRAELGARSGLVGAALAAWEHAADARETHRVA